MTKILDETITETTIRVHASDKPWMTSYIKREISTTWHRSISQLVGCEGANSNNNEISNSPTDAAEILQNVFTKPWSNLPETIIPT